MNQEMGIDMNASPDRKNHVPDSSRRKFLDWLTALLGLAIATMLAVPVLGYVLSPLRRRSADAANDDFFDAGAWSDLTEGEPQLVSIEMTHRNGWTKSQVRHSIWVLKTGADSAVVFSPICPHLGCPVSWDASLGEYACPCHSSFFNKKGDVLGGPAPRSLDPLPFEIRNGRLLIQWIDFRQGTPRREAVTV